MLIVISPAKNLDYETPTPTKKHTKAALLDDASELMAGLKELSPQGVSSLMGISDKLGVLNYDRFQQWSLPFNASNARQAVLAFKGDVYVGWMPTALTNRRLLSRSSICGFFPGCMAC